MADVPQGQLRPSPGGRPPESTGRVKRRRRKSRSRNTPRPHSARTRGRTSHSRTRTVAARASRYPSARSANTPARSRSPWSSCPQLEEELLDPVGARVLANLHEPALLEHAYRG